MMRLLSDVRGQMFLVCRIATRYVKLVNVGNVTLIRSFKDRTAEAVWNGAVAKGFPADLVRPAQRKLAMLAAAVSLEALRRPPGNRLEALKGDRAGQHSLRINDQWRICFTWKDGGAEAVEITDYH